MCAIKYETALLEKLLNWYNRSMANEFFDYERGDDIWHEVRDYINNLKINNLKKESNAKKASSKKLK